MKEVLVVENGRRKRVVQPFIQDLLFVHSTRQELDPVILMTSTLQYRFVKGLGYMQPMTVPEAQMNEFVHAVESSSSHLYLMPCEVGTATLGKQIQIVGGPLDGMQGKLVRIGKGRTKHILVEIPGIVAAAVEVRPEYIKIIRS